MIRIIADVPVKVFLSLEFILPPRSVCNSEIKQYISSGKERNDILRLLSIMIHGNIKLMF